MPGVATAEAITRVNERYYKKLNTAHGLPRTTKKGKVAVRRARLVSQARKERREALVRLGVRPWR